MCQERRTATGADRRPRAESAAPPPPPPPPPAPTCRLLRPPTAPVACLLPPDACSPLLVVCSLSPAACCLLPAACRMSPFACRLSPAACRLLFPLSACRLSPVACLLPPDACPCRLRRPCLATRLRRRPPPHHRQRSCQHSVNKASTLPVGTLAYFGSVIEPVKTLAPTDRGGVYLPVLKPTSRCSYLPQVILSAWCEGWGRESVIFVQDKAEKRPRFDSVATTGGKYYFVARKYLWRFVKTSGKLCFHLKRNKFPGITIIYKSPS